ALESYLTRPHALFRQLFANGLGSSTSPLVLDLGAPAGGKLWSVQQVNLSANDAFSSAVGSALGTQTTFENSGNPVAPGAGATAGVVYVATIEATLITSSTSGVAGAIFVGGIPSVRTFNLDLSSMVASGLSVPGSYQAGGKSLVATAGQHLYAALSGALSSFN